MLKQCFTCTLIACLRADHPKDPRRVTSRHRNTHGTGRVPPLGTSGRCHKRRWREHGLHLRHRWLDRLAARSRCSSRAFQHRHLRGARGEGDGARHASSALAGQQGGRHTTASGTGVKARWGVGREAPSAWAPVGELRNGLPLRASAGRSNSS